MRIALLILVSAFVGCSGPGTQHGTGAKILTKTFSGQLPEEVTPKDPVDPRCTLQNDGNCPAIKVAVTATENQDGTVTCGVTGVDPLLLNIHGQDRGWVVWEIEQSGLFKLFQFRSGDGIDVLGNDKRWDFLDLERAPGADWFADTKVRRRAINKRILKFHYNINIQYRKSIFRDWLPCTEYDPVIVNRD